MSSTKRALALPVLVAAMALTVLSGAACDFFDPGLVTVAEDADGTTVQLHTGNTLEVRLPANPSTGYTWVQVADIADVLEVFGEPEFTPASDGGGVGAGGTVAHRYQAIAVGEATLRFEHRRPFEPDEPPSDTYGITVVVR